MRAENGGGPVATDPAPSTTGGAVRVTVTQAGWGESGSGVEVTGFVGGVVEDGGTCRATLTHDGKHFTAQRAALADATTTACGVLELGDKEMSSGWWEATLSYESATSSGVSKPVAVLVPTR